MWLKYIHAYGSLLLLFSDLLLTSLFVFFSFSLYTCISFLQRHIMMILDQMALRPPLPSSTIMTYIRPFRLDPWHVTFLKKYPCNSVCLYTDLISRDFRAKREHEKKNFLSVSFSIVFRTAVYLPSPHLPINSI